MGGDQWPSYRELVFPGIGAAMIGAEEALLNLQRNFSQGITSGDSSWVVPLLEFGLASNTDRQAGQSPLHIGLIRDETRRMPMGPCIRMTGEIGETPPVTTGGVDAPVMPTFAQTAVPSGSDGDGSEGDSPLTPFAFAFHSNFDAIVDLPANPYFAAVVESYPELNAQTKMLLYGDFRIMPLCYGPPLLVTILQHDTRLLYEFARPMPVNMEILTRAANGSTYSLLPFSNQIHDHRVGWPRQGWTWAVTPPGSRQPLCPTATGCGHGEYHRGAQRAGIHTMPSTGTRRHAPCQRGGPPVLSPE